MKTLAFSFLFIQLPLCYTNAQQKIVAKVVDTETKKPIHQASITIKGTSTGALTNAAGFFELLADVSDSLIVQNPGYNHGIMKVPLSKNFIIPLKKGNNVFLKDNEFEKGLLEDGYKVGIWDYFDSPGKVSIKVNHSTGQYLYLERDTSQYFAYENGEWQPMSMDVQPRYLGSWSDFIKIIASNIRYPAEARRNVTTGTVYVLFDVDTTGQIQKFEVINDIGDNCGSEAVRALKQVPNYWVAAAKGNKKYRSRFIQPVTFKLESEKRKNKAKVVPDLPKAKMLEEVVIVGWGNFR